MGSPTTEITEYTRPSDQLHDAFGLIRLQLQRYLHRRPWPKREDEEPMELLNPEVRWWSSPELDEQIRQHRRSAAERAEKALYSELDLPLAQVQAAFALTGLELELLVAGMAWQVDPGVSRAYRYAWNDYNRHVPNLGFLLDLVAEDRDQVEELRKALQSGLLLELRLLRTVLNRRLSPDHSLIHRHVRADDQMIAWLLGEETSAGTTVERRPAAQDLVLDDPVRKILDDFPGYLRRVHPDRPPLLLVGPEGSGRTSVSRALARRLNIPFVAAEISVPEHNREAPTRGPDLRSQALDDAVRVAVRDARFFGGLLHITLDDEDGIFSTEHAALLDDTGAPVTIGYRSMEPHLLNALGMPPVLDLRTPSIETRQKLWQREAGEMLDAGGFDRLPALAATSGVTPAMIKRSVSLAASQSRFRSGGKKVLLSFDELEHAARLQVEHNLNDLADRIEVRGAWEDLVVKEGTARQLEEVVAFARQRRHVLDVWQLRSKIGYGSGLSVLFSGPPGTGKTFAAGLLAKRLGSELYRIDLSQVVDKYIGETEKRLARIFDEAERAEAILLFDEADSLFGGRTSVSSSTDRYANLEVNYLLQRMENYEGVTILTTNFESAIDEAFMRRLRFKVSFPAPDLEERMRLWQALLPPGAPIEDDIDFEELAEDFELAGGLIKNAVLRASVLAAEEGSPINHHILIEGARREYAEQGFLVREGAKRPSQKRKDRDS